MMKSLPNRLANALLLGIMSVSAMAQEAYDPKTDPNKLRDYADEIGLNIGVCVPVWNMNLSSTTGEVRQIYENFNMVVAENEMKMDAIQPSRGQFNFTNGDNLVNFARSHNMKVRGHCLCWHSQVPKWISSDGYENDKGWTREELLKILHTHIQRTMVHFRGKVAEWDVVNECVNDWPQEANSTNGKYTLRESVWYKVIGEDFIDSAFVWAHKYDPDAVLYLNDYGADHYGTSGKSQALYNLAKRLKASGIPIHGVGLQCHLDVGDQNLANISTNIMRYGKVLGLNCIITELDLGTDSDSNEAYNTQATNYATIIDGVLKRDNCPTFMVWGLNDNRTWRGGKHPLLFDSSQKEKPAYYSVLNSLHNRYEELIASGINDVTTEPQAQKFTPGNIYTTSGQLVGRAETIEDILFLPPGIYIVNRQKYYVK